MAPVASLTLPTLPKMDMLLDLPVSVPAFAAINAEAPEPNASLWPGTGEPDEPAQLESAFDLERFYPRIARLRSISGKTYVRITIDERGQVLSAHVYNSTPQGVFEIATQDLARSLTFRPARLQGKPVASTKDLVIDWTLK
jgi:TonB family protein